METTKTLRSQERFIPVSPSDDRPHFPADLPMVEPDNQRMVMMPPPDFPVEDPTAVTCQPAYDQKVDLNTPTMDYGDLVEIAYRPLPRKTSLNLFC